MLKAYQGYHPRQVVWVFLPAILIWLPAFLWPASFPQRIAFVDSPASSYVAPLAQLPALLKALFAFLYWLFTGYLLTALNHRYLFLRTRSLLPLFFFLTLTSPVTGLSEINNFALTLPVFVLTLHLLFRTYRNNKLDFSFFTVAFLTGIISLVALKSSVFMVIIWISLLSLRPFYLREWLVSLLGFLTPWVLFFGIAYLFDKDLLTLCHEAFSSFSSSWPGYRPDIFQMIFLGWLGAVTLAASVYAFLSLSAMKTRSRKFHMIFFWTAILALILMIRFRSCWLSFFTLLAIPLSFLLSLYFAGERSSLWKRILFDLYIAGFIFLFVSRLMR